MPKNDMDSVVSVVNMGLSYAQISEWLQRKVSAKYSYTKSRLHLES